MRRTACVPSLTLSLPSVLAYAFRMTSPPMTADAFLGYVSKMLERPDFLIPLAAAQRQFRADSYQMASASQLEDLFHDALSMYLREAFPGVVMNRRTGKELWDYEVGGLRLSHKESVASPSLAVWWTAGRKEGDSKRYQPMQPTWTYEVPIVFVLASPVGSASFLSRASSSLFGQATHVLKSGGPLGSRAIRGKIPVSGQYGLALLSFDDLGSVRNEGSSRLWEVLETWRPGGWENLNFHDVWPSLGGDGLSRRDLWLFPQREFKALAGPQGYPTHLEFVDETVPPGIFVLEGAGLREMPLIANNRAHLVDPDYVITLLQEALRAGLYTPFPSWYAHFAEMTPPNLYAQQRVQFEHLFAPRTRLQ